MTFGDLLQNKKDAIVQRWFDGVLATYLGDTPTLFKRQKDPFANPVGHCLRVGTQRMFEALIDGMDDEKIHPDLREIIRIRAIQQFSASQAVGFIFRLKDAVRTELGKAVDESRFSSELAELEERIDRVALDAFDIFVECREQVYELRVNEVKRRVSWIMDKMSKRTSEPELVQLDIE